jgi:TM2 domain-containing membrane protein YozV
MQDRYNKSLAIVLALFLGGIGAHKFYQGKWIQGLIYLLFAWTFVPAIVAVVDAILIGITPKEKCVRS